MAQIIQTINESASSVPVGLPLRVITCKNGDCLKPYIRPVGPVWEWYCPHCGQVYRVEDFFVRDVRG